MSSQSEREGANARWWRAGLNFRAILTYGLPLLAIMALHMLLFPPIRTAPSLKLEVGDITEHEIRAPFRFSAPRPRRELEAARLEASRRVEPVYLHETEAEKHSKDEVARFLSRVKLLASSDSLSLAKKVGALQSDFRGISSEHLRWLLTGGNAERKSNAIASLAEKLLDRGIVDTTPRGNYSLVHVIDPDSLEDRVEEVDDLVLGYRQGEAARKEAGEYFRRADERVAVAAILAYLLTPNLSYDDARTEEQRSMAVAAVPTTREFARNERILDSGVRVNREDLAVLTALEEARRERAFASNKGVALRLRTGRAILVLSLLLGLCLSLSGRHRRQLSEYRRFLALCVLLALYLLVSWVALGRGAYGPIVVPIVMLVMLSTILQGEGPAARMLLLSVLLIALLPSIPSSMLLVWIVAGATAMRMVRRVRNRNQFYKAIGVVSIAYLVSVGALQLGQANSLREWIRPVLWGVGSGIVSTALALFLLPVFESIFEITTDLTLLELSDLNHPLLRRMALESPGTFHHSQVVGTLAEAAGRAIDANCLRTRVGANYHDIGKLLKPRYYVENQKGGPNAHDDLSPRMSALVIAAHVKDGVELGRQWGLPQDVTDFIPQHHGTSVMRYFYHKALERDDGGAVKVEDFRYPGPKPQSKETAIVMLADGVEAGTRSLRRPTPSRIREMVKGIIERRMEEGELDDCTLTMRDISRIREAFVPILVGIHHQRVAYPGQKEHEDKKEKESVETRARGRRGQDSVATRR
jgi:hypothetical protein